MGQVYRPVIRRPLRRGTIFHMPSGRPNRPLFDLIGDPSAAPARRPAAEPTPRPQPARAVEAPTDPAAPATQPRIEVMRGELRGQGGSPGRGDSYMRIPVNAVYLAIAALVVVVIVVRVVSYSGGKAAGVAQTERELGVLGKAATPSDPLNTGEVSAATDSSKSAPTATGTKPPTKPAADPKGTKSASKPQATPATQAASAPATTEAGVLAGKGSILTAAGRTDTDPRQAETNYLVLAIIGESEAAPAVAFLNSNGLPAFAVPNSGDRRAAVGKPTFQLIALPGLSSAQIKKNDEAKRSLEQRASRLGGAWKASKQGTIDFAQAYWAKYDR
jgi:hypothetical protein